MKCVMCDRAAHAAQLCVRCAVPCGLAQFKRIEELSGEWNQADGNSTAYAALEVVVLEAVAEVAMPGVGSVVFLTGPVPARLQLGLEVGKQQGCNGAGGQLAVLFFGPGQGLLPGQSLAPGAEQDHGNVGAVWLAVDACKGAIGKGGADCGQAGEWNGCNGGASCFGHGYALWLEWICTVRPSR